LTLARKALRWDEATEPSRIVGPLHYVGTAGLASYPFVTKEGHILFNTGTPDSGPMTVESIRKLGVERVWPLIAELAGALIVSVIVFWRRG
jgi:metallo-beta-lactamase class B